jgi:hypothetical protein
VELRVTGEHAITSGGSARNMMIVYRMVEVERVRNR